MTTNEAAKFIEPDAVARAYIDAVGAHDLAALDELFAETLVARFAGADSTKGEWVTALRRLLPILVRNDIREIFESGDRVAVVYDFVTDTLAGAVLCVELLSIHDGRIHRIELLLDRVAFAPVQVALQERAAG
jgi:ketosteroid isomerase-like protein